MIIRKQFKFENAHIVRDCSTLRCSQNIHGHSYRVEVLLESDYLDNGQMVYDFGLMKLYISDLIDSFDHAITLWSGDDKGYIEAMKKYSQRWVELPVSPSAEQLSRVIYLMVQKVLELSTMNNQEQGIKLHSTIVHETQTGYAQAYENDAKSEKMGKISLSDIVFSEQVRDEWSDSNLWDKILKSQKLPIPKQV